MLNIPTKADGVDTLSAAEFNSLNNELKNTIESSGQTLAGGDLFQIAKTMGSYVSSGSFYTDSGSVNNYVLSPLGSFKTPTTYLDGMEVSFVVGTTNTSASTINVNSLGSKALVDGSGNVLTANHLVSGTMITAKYNLSADHFKVQLIPQATPTDSSPGRAILNGGHGIGRNPASNTTADANTLTVPGMYSLSSSSTNIPSAVNGTLLVYTSSDTNNLSQEFNAHSTNEKWLRSRSAGTWSAWTSLVITSQSQTVALTGALAGRGNVKFSRVGNTVTLSAAGTITNTASASHVYQTSTGLVPSFATPLVTMVANTCERNSAYVFSVEVESNGRLTFQFFDDGTGSTLAVGSSAIQTFCISYTV